MVLMFTTCVELLLLLLYSKDEPGFTLNNDKPLFSYVQPTVNIAQHLQDLQRIINPPGPE